MKISTVADIKEMEVNENIKCFQGKVKSFFPPKEPDQFQQIVQSVTLQDIAGYLIRAQFKNCQIFKTEGEEVRITSVNNPKHGWLGISYKPYTSKIGVFTPQLVVTKSAMIESPNSLPKPDIPPKPITSNSRPPEGSVVNTGRAFAPVEQPKPTDWDAKERRTIRGIAASYAKDLLIAGKIDEKGMNGIVNKITDIIYEVEINDDDFKTPASEIDFPGDAQ